jgi:hypothetical protein
MAAFVTEYGHSQTPKWKENLRATRPVYHLDLAVSIRSKTSSFVITTPQVERVSNWPCLALHKFANHEFLDATIQDV